MCLFHLQPDGTYCPVCVLRDETKAKKNKSILIDQALTRSSLSVSFSNHPSSLFAFPLPLIFLAFSSFTRFLLPYTFLSFLLFPYLKAFLARTWQRKWRRCVCPSPGSWLGGRPRSLHTEWCGPETQREKETVGEMLVLLKCPRETSQGFAHKLIEPQLKKK